MPRLIRDAQIGKYLDFALTLRRYTAFGEDAANFFDGTHFRKVFSVNNGLYLLELRPEHGGVWLALHPEVPADHEAWRIAQQLSRKLLGLDFDIAGFYAFAAQEPVLDNLVQRYTGFRPTLTPDPFEMLVTSISAQQINLRFAFTVRSRLIREFGARVDGDTGTYYAFPQPETLAAVPVQTYREMQFSARKAEYIIEVARKFASGDLNPAELAELPEARLYATLTAIRGIGRWTVDWFLARHLGRGTAFPAGDLGVRKAVEKFYFHGRQTPEHELRRFAEQWGPHTNLAVHYLLLGWLDRL